MVYLLKFYDVRYAATRRFDELAVTEMKTAQHLAPVLACRRSINHLADVVVAYEQYFLALVAPPHIV